MLQLRLAALAIGLHSRLPVGARLRAWAGAHPASIVRCDRYLPLAGLVISLLTAMTYAMFALVLPHSVAVLVAMTAGLMLSGTRDHALLAASADSIGAAPANGAAGAPAIGTRGVIALAMLLLLDYETLSSIDPSWIGVTLVGGGTFARAVALMVATGGPAAPGGSPVAPEAAAALAARDRRFDAWVAFAIGLAPVLALAWWTAEWGLFVLAGALSFGCATWFRHIHTTHLAARAEVGAATTPPGSLRLVAQTAFMIGVLASLAVIDEVVADPAS